MKNLISQLLLTIFILGINISYSQTWVQQSSGTSLNLNSVYFLDANTGFIGADSGRVLKTTNGGLSWALTTTGFNFNIISIKFFSSTSGIAAGEKVIKTTNSGLNWNVVLDTAYATDICYLNSNTWYISCILPHSNKMTSNQGITWSNLNYSDIFQTSIFFLDLNTGWIAGKGVGGTFVGQHLDKTINSGMNWSSLYSNILLNGNGWFYDVYFLNNLTGFGAVTESNGIKIIKTSNGGVNWTSTTTPTSQKNLFFINNSIGWTCGFSGMIMKTLNTGDSWTSEQTPVNAMLNSIYFTNNETGWTCGLSGTILKTTNGGITLIQQIGNNVPDNYSLSQNYPNPFNPSTLINFDIPKTSYVSLVVYDQLGREIEQLVNNELNPGSYKYDWSAECGALSYPSGIYFYKLQAGEFVETKKMVLIK